MSEEVKVQSPSIPDDKLKILWKQAVTASLSPENNYPAYKLYYIFLRKEIIEKYCPQLETTLTNDEKNLHD